MNSVDTEVNEIIRSREKLQPIRFWILQNPISIQKIEHWNKQRKQQEMKHVSFDDVCIFRLKSPIFCVKDR